MLIILASFSNNSTYYLIKKHENIEVWKGTFSPLGEKHLETLVDASDTIKTYGKYSEETVYPIMFRYYLNKFESSFDNINNNFDLPNFKNIKFLLSKALEYSSFNTDDTAKIVVNNHLNTIDRIIYLCRADMCASLNTYEGLNEAIMFLNKAIKLTNEEAFANFIAQKISMIEQSISNLDNSKNR